MRPSQLRLAQREGERGQTLVLFVLGLTAFMALTALTIDGGLTLVNRREMQTTADAAALAAGDTLLEGDAVSTAVSAAQAISAANGFDEADPDVVVTVNIPPTSGPYSGVSGYSEVTIEKPIDSYFAGVLGVTSFDVSARAVVDTNPEEKPYSIIALNPSACRSMQFNGNVSVTIIDAGTLTNSECYPDAFYAEGQVSVVDESNDVVGGWVQSGTSGTISPRPYPVGHHADPMADVPEPTPIEAPVRACPTYGGPAGTKTLHPGVYNCTIDPPGAWALDFLPGDYYIKGGIVIDGSGGPVTFGSGLYYLEGRGLIVTGNSDVTGDGVTFFINKGETVLTGSGVFNLDAPSSGPYEGIVIFQARQLTSTVELTGNSVSDGWGTVYAAGAQIHVTGNATTSFQFIGDTFLTDGATNITIDFYGGRLAEVPFVRLVE